MFLIVLIVSWSCGALAQNEWDYLCEDLPMYTRIPHPYDCTKYFQCMEEGQAYPAACPPGFAYDLKLENCLPEDMVDCSHISTTSQTTEGTTTVETSSEATTSEESTSESSTTDSTTTESSTTEPTTSEPSTTETGAGEWDFLCKDVKPGTVVLHPNDCKKFFQCMENEQALDGNCLEGQAFDKVMGICLPESMVDCSHIITTTENNPTSTTPVTSSETTPEETSESTSTEESTTESSTTELTTESSTEVPTSTTDVTTPEESSTEPSTTTEESTSTEETTTTEEITSTSTTVSTTEEITTTTPDSTTESSSTSPSSTTTALITSTDPSPTPTITYPPGTSISPGPEIPEPGVQCPPLSKTQGKPVFLPSKKDCSKYYLCYVGLPVPLKCQTGTHFNQFEENCDDPFFAHCQVKGYVDPNPYPECPRLGKFNLPRIDNCEYFVYCNEGVGRLQKCPFYYGWDILTQRCILRNLAVCASDNTHN